MVVCEDDDPPGPEEGWTHPVTARSRGYLPPATSAAGLIPLGGTGRPTPRD
jgi:hypothetical protein